MDSKQILDRLCRNAVDVIDGADLESRLKEGKPLRVKAGFDPSAPDIHLGHTVLLRKLREFQDLGHKVVLLIGDFTAMIGDPTGKTATRPALSEAEVDKNARTYQEQAFRILDKDPKKIEIVHNRNWLGKMSLGDFVGKVASLTTVARVLERDDFEKRLADNQPLSVREFLYPMFQGYDSVEIKADVELGGTDQKFNLLMGRQLQKSFGQRPQIVMTLPLLVGLDGVQKMSKSLGNSISVNDTSKDMFGKAMSIPDTLMASYYNLLTSEDGGRIFREVTEGKLHPMEAKKRLAFAIVASFHGEKIAAEERAEFERVFSRKETPENPDELSVSSSAIGLLDLLKKAGAVTSTSEARRLVEQGGVSLDGERLSDPQVSITPKDGSLLRAGKKKYFKLVVQK